MIYQGTLLMHQERGRLGFRLTIIHDWPCIRLETPPTADDGYIAHTHTYQVRSV